ncbi:MAG: AI-2E family transporter [Gammaproteobacteria bacterium]|jgi:predicted PurR-regulated permease PerM
MNAQANDLRRTFVTAAALAVMIAAGFLLWQLSQVVLVLFAAVLFAIFLDALTGWLLARVPVPRYAAVVAVTLLIIGSVLGVGWITEPRVIDQLAELREQLPAALDLLRDRIERQPWGAALLANTPAPAELVPSATDILGRISGVFSTTLGALVNIGLILVTGFYLALDPGVYVRGIKSLVPARGEGRAGEILGAIAHALRWWLVGRIAAMTAVGVLTAVGLSLIGMPLVLALATVAGLLSFIPFVGPILSVVPAVLIALVEPADPLKPIWVLMVYAVVQFLEGNFITPLIQRRAVSLPPAVLLSAQLLLGVLFGFLGILLATPLAVVVILLCQTIYIQDLLGRPISVLGQSSDR